LLRRTLEHLRFEISDLKSQMRNSAAEVCDATMMPKELMAVTKQITPSLGCELLF
jgi:hypothetical protein